MFQSELRKRCTDYVGIGQEARYLSFGTALATDYGEIHRSSQRESYVRLRAYRCGTPSSIRNNGCFLQSS
jgi:hypothetical protein